MEAEKYDRVVGVAVLLVLLTFLYFLAKKTFGH